MPTPNEQLAALTRQLEAMRKENEALKVAATKTQTLTLKVSEKGAVSLYGMGRFPMTAYAEQWEKVLAMSDTIKAFIEVNRKAGRIVSKEVRKAAEAASVPLPAKAPGQTSAL